MSRRFPALGKVPAAWPWSPPSGHSSHWAWGAAGRAACPCPRETISTSKGIAQASWPTQSLSAASAHGYSAPGSTENWAESQQTHFTVATRQPGGESGTDDLASAHHCSVWPGGERLSGPLPGTRGPLRAVCSRSHVQLDFSKCFLPACPAAPLCDGGTGRREAPSEGHGPHSRQGLQELCLALKTGLSPFTVLDAHEPGDTHRPLHRNHD